MTEPMTPTTLAADAAQALQRVTEGPWAVHCDPCHYDTASDVKSDCGNLFASVGGGAKWQEQEANARFIAFARAWVPEAAAALTALSEQVAELTRERDEAWEAAPNVAVLWQDFRQEYEDRIHDLKAKLARLEAPDAVEALVKAAEALELACDHLAATRSREVYLALVDSGQSDALLRLDENRQALRAALAAIRAGGKP
jgi:hypothetical protein